MKTLLIVILNLLGIAICFLTKYGNRSDQSKPFSFGYWMKDNWNELLVTLLFDISVMILVMAGDIQIDMTQFLPEWAISTGSLTLSFALGLGVAALIYEIFKKKVKAVKNG